MCRICNYREEFRAVHGKGTDLVAFHVVVFRKIRTAGADGDDKYR